MLRRNLRSISLAVFVAFGLGIALASGQGVGPSIVHGVGPDAVTSPFSGYIDPRFDSNNGVDANLGIDELVIAFSEPVFSAAGGGTVGTSNFLVTETGGGAPPTVVSVTDVSGENTVFTISLSRPITVQEWTTVQAIVQNGSGVAIENNGNLGPGANEPDRIDIGMLPGDMDQNVAVQPLDFLRARQMWAGTFQHPRGATLLYLDTDRNGRSTPIDLARLRQLYVGTGNSTRIWNGQIMNGPQP